jgi:hypothetical protein
MLHHTAMGNTPPERQQKLARLIRSGRIGLGGYYKGKIYGLLHCASGKRMKTENRVFFRNEEEALAEGFRPCGHCLPGQYKLWKAGRLSLQGGTQQA